MKILFGLIKETGWTIYYFSLCLFNLPIFPSLTLGELSRDKLNIILVYGFLGMPKTFLPLKKRLEKLGYNVLIADVGWTVKDIFIHAQKLILFLENREIILKKNHGQTINNLKNKIIFFGHSMGGLIILEAQRLNPELNKIKVITCGTPINGTPIAYTCSSFNKAAKQMTPSSDFLKTLKQDIKTNGRQLEQLKAKLDVVVPHHSSSILYYQSQTVPIIGHVALVFSLSDELLKKVFKS